MNLVRHAAIIAAYREARRDQMANSTRSYFIPAKTKVQRILLSGGYSDEECSRMWEAASAVCLVNLLDMSCATSPGQAEMRLMSCGYALTPPRIVELVGMLREDMEIARATLAFRAGLI